MLLTDQEVSRFQDIYFREFGKHISLEEARQKGAALVQLLAAVVKKAPCTAPSAYQASDCDKGVAK